MGSRTRTSQRVGRGRWKRGPSQRPQGRPRTRGKVFRRKRRGEVYFNLAQMRRGLLDELDYNASETPPGQAPLLPSTTQWTPPGCPCDHPNNWFPGNEGDWQAEGWRYARFFLNVPHHYQYRIESSVVDESVQVRFQARGDLDCDGTFSNFSSHLEYNLKTHRYSDDARVLPDGDPLE